MIISLMLALIVYATTSAQEKPQIVRLAKIEVDSAQLDRYKILLKEGIEAAVRLEPGVMTLFAMYEKDQPTHITVLEMYADQEAYQKHLQTPHFKRYKTATKDMVKKLELIDVVPIGFETKMK